MLNKKNTQMSPQMQEDQPTDGSLRDFVRDVNGQNKTSFQDMRSNKNRVIDEQNKMIDKHNLRK